MGKISKGGNVRKYGIKYSFVPNWSGWSNCKFWEKKPPSSCNCYKRMIEKEILIIFPLVHFIRLPPWCILFDLPSSTISHKRVGREESDTFPHCLSFLLKTLKILDSTPLLMDWWILLFCQPSPSFFIKNLKSPPPFLLIFGDVFPLWKGAPTMTVPVGVNLKTWS